MSDRSRLLFEGRDAEEVARVLREHFGPVLERVSAALTTTQPTAMTFRLYVRAYREMTTSLSRCAVELQRVPPTLVLLDRERQLYVLGDLLSQSAAAAPFSRWATRYDLGVAAALHALDNLRELEGLPVLAPPAAEQMEGAFRQAASARYTSEDIAAFLSTVRSELAHGDESPLARVKRAFELSDAELGHLFGVSRQAAQQWQARGTVPADRQAKLAVLVELVELLEAQLQEGLLPGVARRPAEAYGGRTMLEVIAADEHEWLLEDTRRLFDWSIAA